MVLFVPRLTEGYYCMCWYYLGLVGLWILMLQSVSGYAEQQREIKQCLILRYRKNEN